MGWRAPTVAVSPPLLEPLKRGLGPNKYPRDIMCIMGLIIKGTIPMVPPFSLLKYLLGTNIAHLGKGNMDMLVP